jgi:hypothetical protein
LEWFDDLRSRQIKAYRANNNGIADWIDGSGGLYLFGTIGLDAILMSDGTVMLYNHVEWDEGDGHETRHIAPEEERIAALVIGARRMPILATLLPRRPDVAPDCAFCSGTGVWSPSGIICPKCSGLGWARAAE